MAISRVEIRNLRNLESVCLDPSPGINILTGPNGAGKTSILEGIYMLGRGRSFRTNLAKPIIREGADCVEVVGRRIGTPALVAGIRRSATVSEVRINGESIDRMSELARHFPVQLVTPRSHELLERGPDLRRRFLDWGLFHVEPAYGSLVARYNRVLKQRNAALKRKSSEATSWDPQLADFGEQIHTHRYHYLQSVKRCFDTVNEVLGLESAPDLSLTCSWDREIGLLRSLERKRDTDSATGFTSVGPHRDDVKVQFHGQAAVDRLSRGQQKLLVLGLILSQLEQVSGEDRPLPILLVDDLAAELDEKARDRVMAYLVSTGVQVFVSSLQPEILGELPSLSEVFHVEQGRLLI